jgi:hypothetical protein
LEADRLLVVVSREGTTHGPKKIGSEHIIAKPHQIEVPVPQDLSLACACNDAAVFKVNL